MYALMSHFKVLVLNHQGNKGKLCMMVVTMDLDQEPDPLCVPCHSTLVLSWCCSYWYYLEQQGLRTKWVS